MSKSKNTGKLIDELVKNCKATVHITFNEHKTNYETVEEYLSDNRFDRFSGVEPGLKQEIIDKDFIVEVQAYPRTPVGFILAIHHDLNTALEQAIEGAKEY